VTTRRAACAAVLLLVCAASCRRETAAPSRDLRFARERVVVEVSPGRTRVAGWYWFSNDSDAPLELSLFYPFPVDSVHLYPSEILVERERGSGREPLGFARQETGVVWRMAFGPREETAVRVEYVQEILDRHAVYIVTTTRHWARPIDVAEFEFRVPADIGNVNLSFVPDTKEAAGDTAVYRLKRTRFMPTGDLVVTWD